MSQGISPDVSSSQEFQLKKQKVEAKGSVVNPILGAMSTVGGKVEVPFQTGG